MGVLPRELKGKGVFAIMEWLDLEREGLIINIKKKQRRLDIINNEIARVKQLLPDKKMEEED